MTKISDWGLLNQCSHLMTLCLSKLMRSIHNQCSAPWRRFSLRPKRELPTATFLGLQKSHQCAIKKGQKPLSDFSFSVNIFLGILSWQRSHHWVNKAKALAPKCWVNSISFHFHDDLCSLPSGSSSIGFNPQFRTDVGAIHILLQGGKEVSCNRAILSLHGGEM